MSKKPDTTEATTPTLANATPAQLQAALFEARKRKLENIKVFFESNKADYEALGIEVLMHFEATLPVAGESKHERQTHDFVTEGVKAVNAPSIPEVFNGLFKSLIPTQQVEK